MSEIQGSHYWLNRKIDDEKRDWKEKQSNWIWDYWESRNHPHRQLIIDALKNIEFKSLLELGSNCGPNLYRIGKEFPGRELVGLDINEDAVNIGTELLPNVLFELSGLDNLPYKDKSFDIVLADAVLMYVGSDDIEKVMDEITRVAKRAVILLEWQSRSLEGEILDFHWARDYASILRDHGFTVVSKPVGDAWKTGAWPKHGWIYVATR